MYFLIELLEDLSKFMLRHLPQICAALTATLMAVYGTDINKKVRHNTAKWHFLARFALFVFLCSFGYGAISYFATRLFIWILQQVSLWLLAPLIICIFLVVGLLAEDKNKI